MTDLLIAAASAIALLAYATVGVAAGRVTERVVPVRHERSCNLGGRYPDREGYGCDCSALLVGVAVPVVSGVFWPFVLIGLTVGYAVRFIAKGPSTWGTAIAAHLVGRSERKRVAAQEAADRVARIAELERELGIGGQ